MKNSAFQYGLNKHVRGIGTPQGTPVPPGKLVVSKRAVALWKAESYDPTLDALVDLSGNGHHARFGSTVGSDTNDPLRLEFNGEKYFHMPGVNGNSAHGAADPTPLSISHGEFRVDFRPLVTSAGGLISTYNYPRVILSVSTGKYTPAVLLSDDSYHGPGNIATDIAVGERRCARFTWQYDGTTLTFKGYEGSSMTGPWTFLGTLTSTPSLPLKAADKGFGLGARDSLTNGAITADYYHAQWWDDLEENGGQVVGEFIPADSTEPHTSFTSSTTGETWTINRSSTGRKAVLVDRPLLLFGTDDYLYVAAHDDFVVEDSGQFTGVIVTRRYPQAAYVALLAAAYRWEDGIGWVLGSRPSPTLRVNANVSSSAETTPSFHPDNSEPQGVARLLFLTGDGTTLTVGSPGNTKTGTQPDGQIVPNTQALTIGRPSATTEYADMEFVGAAIFREALSASDLAILAREFGVSV